MLERPLLIGWPEVPPNTGAPWWFPEISFRPCMSFDCLGLASSDTQCLVSTKLQSSVDECNFGEVDKFRYCFCMQRAAASPKNATASSAEPKYSENSKLLMMIINSSLWQLLSHEKSKHLIHATN